MCADQRLLDLHCNTNLKIHNDGKKKHQSFEAYFELFQRDMPHIHGYGEDKEDAVADLKRQVADFLNEILKLDYENSIEVDWQGKEIAKKA